MRSSVLWLRWCALLLCTSCSLTLASVEECVCYGSDLQQTTYDADTGAVSSVLLFDGESRVVSLGDSGRLYALGSCFDDSHGADDALHEVLYRSANGEDWICMNTRMAGSDEIHSRFGARSSGISQVLQNPYDNRRAVALSSGPTYWTIVDTSDEEPWVSGMAGPGFLIEFTFTDVLFNQFDPDKLLLVSLDESMYIRWFTSRDYGNTTYVMGLEGYRMFDCQFGTDDAIICNCMIYSPHAEESISQLCLTTDFGYTVSLLPVEDESARYAVLSAVWHLDAEHSVLYALSASDSVVYYSLWNGTSYEPLQRVELEPPLSASISSLIMVDSTSVYGEVAFLYASLGPLTQLPGYGYHAALVSVTQKAPGFFTVLLDDSMTVEEPFSTKRIIFPSFASAVDSVSEQPVLLASRQVSNDFIVFRSIDFGRSWIEIDNNDRYLNLTGIGIGFDGSYMMDVHQSPLLYRPMFAKAGLLYSYLLAAGDTSHHGHLRMSSDFGKTWRAMYSMEGPGADCAVSACGSLSVAIVNPSAFLSRDNGISWVELFPQRSVEYDFLYAMPPSNDGQYVRFVGHWISTVHGIEVLSIPSADQCVGQDEPGSNTSSFEQWSISGGECVGGQTIIAERRKLNATCSLLGMETTAVLYTEPCQCTLYDTQCNVPYFWQDGLHCVSDDPKTVANPDAYIRSPGNVCEGVDEIYLGASTVALPYSTPDDAYADSPADIPGGDITGSNNPGWTPVVLAAVGGIFALFGLSMCVLSGLVLMKRTLRRRDESRVFGVSSKELQLIDGEIEGMQDDGDELELLD